MDRGRASRSDFYAGRLKRVIDLIAALMLFVILSPVLIGLVLGQLAFGGKGPIFFRHTRIGKAGKSFECLKFRSMVADADRVLLDLLRRDPAAKLEWETTQKFTRDPRVSRFGRLLRRTSLDELPQLWNVLRGDMSLVGPRPVTASEMNKWYERLDGAVAYKSVRPGITGLWQVSGRSTTSYEQRVRLDSQYLRELSLETDARILCRTLSVVLRQDGAH